MAKKELQAGDKAPDFAIATAEGETTRLADYKGRTLVLYFYPKDNTSGCTKEACGFNDALKDLAKLKADVLGVSRDSLASHANFAKKYGLKFKLGADTDGEVTEAYGVWIEKSMYGRKYMGIDRATFLIDGKGVLRGVWRKVKVPGHVEAVRAAIAAL